MTATDELRRLLDERGVGWEDHSGSIEQRTVYRTPNGWCYVSTANDKWLSYVEYHDMTPEQAVEATLGRGTCRAKEQYLDSHSDLTVTVCSGCGVPTDDLEDCNYCPNCGCRIVVNKDE